MAKLVGYRTLLVNILTVAVLALTGVTDQVTDPVTLRWIAIILGVSNLALRFLTTTPVGKLPLRKSSPPGEGV